MRINSRLTQSPDISAAPLSPRSPIPVLKSKAAQFRQLLQSSNLEFLMEAHHGLSARIVEETGFRGVWASGLSISR